MIEYLDKRGVKLEVGQTIAYGKSDRCDPIRIGVVVSITEKHIEVVSRGASKFGMIPNFHADRIIVLPDDY